VGASAGDRPLLHDKPGRPGRLALTEAGAATFEQMEASFDGSAVRLMAHIPEADLVAVSRALEHIRLIVLADCDYIRRTEQAK
jgi:hypothetical protein